MLRGSNGRMFFKIQYSTIEATKHWLFMVNWTTPECYHQRGEVNNWVSLYVVAQGGSPFYKLGTLVALTLSFTGPFTHSSGKPLFGLLGQFSPPTDPIFDARTLHSHMSHSHSYLRQCHSLFSSSVRLISQAHWSQFLSQFSIHFSKTTSTQHYFTFKECTSLGTKC